MKIENSFDKQLWRDFNWGQYLASFEERCSTEEERAELKHCVEILRNVSRLMSSGPVLSNMREIAKYEQTIPKHLLFKVVAMLSMVANAMYKVKHEESCKLNFAIGTINRLVKLCKSKGVMEAGRIHKRFVHELGENIKP